MRIGPGLHLTQHRAAGGSFLAGMPGLQALYRASDYDAEQHAWPNAAPNSNVMGALPGSSHPVFFGRDDGYGDFVYVDQTSASNYIGTFAVAPTVSDVWTAYGRFRMGQATGDTRRLWTTADGADLGYLTNGDIIGSYMGSAGGTGVASGSTVQALLSQDRSDVFDARWVFNGTAYSIDVRIPDGSWVAAASGTAASGVDLDVGELATVGSTSTFQAMGDQCYFLSFHDGTDETATTLMRFDPSMFVAGNRGHGATATDDQGNTWTVTRAGSPLSVIDNGDGRGKRLCGSQTAQNYLRSSVVPVVGSSDLQIDVDFDRNRLPGTAAAYSSCWQGTDKCFIVSAAAGGGLTVIYSDDGTSLSVFQQSSDNAELHDYWRVIKSGTTSTIYYSDDGVTYTANGSATAPATLHNPTTGVDIGQQNNDWWLGGNLFSSEVRVGGALVSAFDANKINRRQWRLDRTVDSTVANETWSVAFTDSAEDANDPVFLDHRGRDYAYTTGANTNYLAQNSTGAIAQDSVISLRADIAASDYTPAALSRVIDSGLYVMIDTNGTLLYSFWDAASTFPSANSTSALPVVDNQDVQVRADHDSANDTVDFYYRFSTAELDDDTGWTQLGTQVAISSNALNGAITGGARSYLLGGQNVAGQHFEGKLYKGVIIDDGTVVWNIDVSDASADGTSFTDSVTGNTVTIHRATSGFTTTIVKEDTPAYGGSHLLAVPYHPDLYPDLSASGEVTFGARFRPHGGAAWGRVLAGRTGTGAGLLLIRNSSNSRFYPFVSDGTTDAQPGDGSEADITLSSELTVQGAFADADQESYVNGASVDTNAIASIGSTDGGENLAIGGEPDGTDYASGVEIFDIYVVNRRFTDAEASTVHAELAGV